MRKYGLPAIAGFILVIPSLVAQSNGTASPAIPEEARRHFVIGTTLFKDAKTPDDYAQVESQFKQAVDLAPQWPDARYDLALAKEAAGDYSGAMADLKLYQQFKLNDAEARKAQDKIYVIEAKAEEAAKKQAVDQANSPAAQPAPAAVTTLVCPPYSPSWPPLEIDLNEANGTATVNWDAWIGPGGRTFPASSAGTFAASFNSKSVTFEDKARHFEINRLTGTVVIKETDAGFETKWDCQVRKKQF